MNTQNWRLMATTLVRCSGYLLVFLLVVHTSPARAQSCQVPHRLRAELNHTRLFPFGPDTWSSYVSVFPLVPGPALGQTLIASSTANFPEQSRHIHQIEFSSPLCTGVLVVTQSYVQYSPLGPPELISAQIQEVDLSGVPGPEWEVSGENPIEYNGRLRVSRKASTAQDQDGDGLLDCEETNGGIDVNCDGSLVSGEDVLFSELHPVLPDPAIPDIYVEVDWADCREAASLDGADYGVCEVIDITTMTEDRRSFEPPAEAFSLIEEEFSDNGYQLHFKKSGPFPATMGVPAVKDFGSGHVLVPDLEGRNTSVGYYAVYSDDDFGDPHLKIQEHFFGDPGDAAGVVAAKASFMRYNIWSHTGTDRTMWGIAPDFGEVFIVGIDTTSLARFTDTSPGNYTVGPQVTAGQSPRIWALDVMHELGHSLGLRHGGEDDLNGKPNYLSVMNYEYQGRLDGSTRSTNLPQLRYNELDRTFDQCALSEVPTSASPESYPLRSAEEFTVGYNCPHISVETHLFRGGPIDWNCDGTAESTEGNYNLFNFVCMQSGGTYLPPLAEDDRITGGFIYNASVLSNINTTLPPNSVIEGDDVDFGTAIGPGPDRVFQTAVAPGDVAKGTVIPGDNNTCDTPTGGDAELISVAGVGAEKPCPVGAWNDWASLHVQLPDNPRLGDTEFGPSMPEGDPGDPPPHAVDWEYRSQLELDLGVEGAAVYENGVVILTFNMENRSPLDSELPAALIVSIPEGAALLSCTGEGSLCTQRPGKAVVQVGPIPAGTTTAVQVLLDVDCPQLGQVYAIHAQLNTVARDPEPANNQASIDLAYGESLQTVGEADPWLLSYSGGTPVPSIGEGDLSLACGNTIFESPAFDTSELGSVGTELLAQLYVPSGSGNGWVGDLQLYVDVPSANLWNAWVGYQSLASLPQGRWTSLSFGIPEHVRQILLDVYPDARFRFASNVASCTAPVKFRGVRFGGSLECQVHEGTVQDVETPPFLTFDSLSDWTVESGDLMATTVAIEGAGALGFEPSGWGRVTSREFSTSELSFVSDTLAVQVGIPELPTDFYWLGGMNAFLTCPEVGFHNRWLGHQALQILFDGEFNQLLFDLSGDIIAVLTGPPVACQLSFEIYSNPAFGPFILDQGGFVP